MSLFSQKFTYWKYRFWIINGRYRRLILLFRLYAWLRNRNISVTSKKSKIVIDGFPRSGNTFLYALFVDVFRISPVAHHIHSESQINLGVKLKKPIIIFVRNPLDSVISLVIRNQSVPLKVGLEDYLRFHKNLLRHINNEACEMYIWNFDDINHIDSLVSRNSYLKSIGITKVTKEDIELINERIEFYDRLDQKNSRLNKLTVSRPHSGRDHLKSHLKEQLFKSKENIEILRQCQSIYSELVQ